MSTSRTREFFPVGSGKFSRASRYESATAPVPTGGVNEARSEILGRPGANIVESPSDREKIQATDCGIGILVSGWKGLRLGRREFLPGSSVSCLDPTINHWRSEPIPPSRSTGRGCRIGGFRPPIFPAGYTLGNFTHRAPRRALLTAVSMNAMPYTPSSIVGKSRSLGSRWPATSAAMARNASR